MPAAPARDDPTSSGLKLSCRFLCLSFVSSKQWLSASADLCVAPSFPNWLPRCSHNLNTSSPHCVSPHLLVNSQHGFFLPGWLMAGAVPSKCLLQSWNLLRAVVSDMFMLPPCGRLSRQPAVLLLSLWLDMSLSGAWPYLLKTVTAVINRALRGGVKIAVTLFLCEMGLSVPQSWAQCRIQVLIRI